VSRWRRQGLPALLLLALATASGGCRGAAGAEPNPLVPCPTPTRGQLPNPLWSGCLPASPGAQVHAVAPDLGARVGTPGPLLAALANSCDDGLELRVLLVPSGPRFSLVDFSDRAFRCGGPRVDRAVLAATPAGTAHARVAWWSHRHARARVRALRQRCGGDVACVLGGLAREVADQQRSRRQRRSLLLIVAAVAGVLLAWLLARALVRRQAPGPQSESEAGVPAPDEGQSGHQRARARGGSPGLAPEPAPPPARRTHREALGVALDGGSRGRGEVAAAGAFMLRRR